MDDGAGVQSSCDHHVAHVRGQPLQERKLGAFRRICGMLKDCDTEGSSHAERLLLFSRSPFVLGGSITAAEEQDLNDAGGEWVYEHLALLYILYD